MENLKEEFFGKVDLSKLQKWKGDYSISREEYFDLLEKKEKEAKNIFCFEFCTGCGRSLFMDKDLARKYYNDIFLGTEHPFRKNLENLDKSKEYIQTNVCENCSEDLFRLEEMDKSLIIDPIPIIKKLT